MKVSCPAPIDEAVLLDYWVGLLDGAEEQAAEEHVFACDACASRLAEMKLLADVLSDLAKGGTLRGVVSEEQLHRAKAKGLRVREYTARPGDVVQCTVTADDDILVARLVADLASAARVDLCWCSERGDILQRLPDVPFRAGSDEVVYQESIRFAKASPSWTMIARLVNVDDSGGERVLGEYTFHHTRSLPGPGTWMP